MKSKPPQTRQQQKEASPHHVIEEAGLAFDPSTQHLDLTKEEKRRTTALMMAIQAYNNLIIKDAEMYMAISREQGKDEPPRIKPATIEAMVMAAIKFDAFISGRLEDTPAEPDRTTPAETEKPCVGE